MLYPSYGIMLEGLIATDGYKEKGGQSKKTNWYKKFMSRKIYDKLIRDKIPEIIRETSQKYKTAVYDNEGYRQALLQKLVEETEEVRAAQNQKEIIDEIADLYEVINAILIFYSIDPGKVIEEQGRKKHERGAFNNRTKLLWVEKPT